MNVDRQVKDDSRPFRIQGEFREYASCTIPWWLAEIAYEEYVRRFSNNQTLERISERGGFGREELVDLIRGRNSNQVTSN